MIKQLLQKLRRKNNLHLSANPGADRNVWRLLAYAEKRKDYTIEQILKSEATRYNK